MIEHNIPPEKLERYLTGLREAQGLMIAHTFNNNEGVRIIEKYRLIYGIWSAAVFEGIYKRVGPGQYYSTLKVIEPIHAVKVIERLRAMAKAATKKRLENTILEENLKNDTRLTGKHNYKPGIKTHKPTAAELHERSKPAYIINPEPKTKPKQKRTFSFLWGLIKFDY